MSLKKYIQTDISEGIFSITESHLNLIENHL